MHGTHIMKKKQPPNKGLLTAPGYEGRFELGERVIDDPFEAGRRITATANVRESAIAHMASRGRINRSQEQAGERFRKLWEQAAIGGARGIDPAKEAVDGGKINDPLNDELVRASIELERALNVLGPIGASILTNIVGEGKRIEDVARKWAQAGGIVAGRRAEGYVTGRMIEAIDQLVSHWRMEGIGKPVQFNTHYTRRGEKVPVRDGILSSGPMTQTGPSHEITVGRFGDAVREERRPVDRGVNVHVAGPGGGGKRRR